LVGFVQHFKTQWHDQPVETCNLPISSFEGKRVKNKQTKKSQKYKKEINEIKKGKKETGRSVDRNLTEFSLRNQKLTLRIGSSRISMAQMEDFVTTC
jgi:hypothetical protein